jgi:HD-GYP domain-containing protein (c-di-GMP phosphodiesterase class II)
MNPEKSEQSEKFEIKTSIEGLRIGMFVSRLDRPWIDSPFLLEGLRIESDDDIEQLRKLCSYVYVDVEKGAEPDRGYWMLNPGLKKYSKQHVDQYCTKSATRPPEGNNPAQSGKVTYPITNSFRSEMVSAKDIYQDINNNLKQMLSDMKQRNELDVEVLKKGVAVMTESIARNPAAMMWIISLRKVDDYSYSRSLGTSVWCATFGRHLGLEMKSLKALALGGLLLDIGKTRLPEELLHKSGPLDPQEMKQMEEHVDIGMKILAKCQHASGKDAIPLEVMQMVATHHERADGSGYPHGLVNKATPLFGRIASIADSYDAMTSKPPYANSEPMTPHEAVNELYELRDKKYQAELIEKFIQAVGLYPTGSLVELNTGEVGAVVALNALKRLQPSIVLLLDKNKKPLSEFIAMDLSQMDRNISVSRGLMTGAYGIDMNELFL